MSRRLYFLLPNVDRCRAVANELLESGIKHRHIHVIGNRFTPLEGLHEASVLQKTEFAHGLELGLSVGGVAGLIGGLLAVSFPPSGIVLGGGALLASALAGAGGAAIVSGLIAKDIPNHKLTAFEKAISAGQLLLLVDVPRYQVETTVELIRRHHPEVEISIA
jgi:hypothetical protein